MTYILWFIGVYAASYSLSQSEIGKVWRKLFEFKQPNKLKNKLNYASKCIICTAFWIGMLATSVFSPAAIYSIPLISQIIINGFISLGAVKLIYVLIERVSNNYE